MYETQIENFTCRLFSQFSHFLNFYAPKIFKENFTSMHNFYTKGIFFIFCIETLTMSWTDLQTEDEKVLMNLSGEDITQKKNNL